MAINKTMGNTDKKDTGGVTGSIQSFFLDDTPITNLSDSKFAVHSRIACAIAEEVESDNPSNIAIVGEWGSGKSTVLALLKEKLNYKDVEFVTFDAWAHAGDTLRKSFLIFLGDSLNPENAESVSLEQRGNKVISEDDFEWRSQRELLEGTEVIETKIEQSKFSPVTAWFVLLAAFFVVTRIVAGSITVFVPCFAPYVDITSGFLSLFVATILAFYLGKKGSKGKSNQNSDWLNDLLSYLLGKPNASAKQKISRAAEYDSIEFEKTYKRVIEHSKLSKQKIIIAIDNLDRLSGNSLTAAWDTVQIFSGQNTIDALGDRRPWIILPIAREAFVELSGKPQRDGQLGIGLGSISKLFVRQFEIPTPLTTDWRNCFCSYLSKAFPDLDIEDAAAVFSVVNTSNFGIVNRTPREAKRIINEMVALSRVYKGVSIISLALFCLISGASKSYSEILDHMRRVFTKADEVNSLIHSWSNDEEKCLDELAMLTYGVFTREAAQEIFVATEIDRLIQKNSAEATVDIDLLTKARPGAWNILHDTVKSRIANSAGIHDVNWYVAIIKSFYEYETNHKDEETIADLNMMWRLLVENIKSYDWPVLQGFGQIVSLTVKDPKFSERERELLYDFILRSGNGWKDKIINDDEENQDNFQLWISETNAVLNALVEAKLLPPKIEMPNFELGYWQFLQALASIKENVYWLSKTSECSETAFLSVSKGLLEVNKGSADLDEKTWSAIRKSPVVSAGLDLGPIDYTSIIQEKSDELYLYLEFWILINERKIISPRATAYIQSFDLGPSDISSLFEDAENWGISEQIAILRLVFDNTEVSWSKPLAGFIKESAIDLDALSENYCDLIPSAISELIALLSVDSSSELALLLLQKIWSEQDYRNQSLDICLAFVRQLEPVSEMKDFGKHFAEVKRTEELLETPYENSLESFYLGVFSAGITEKLSNWLSNGLKSVAEATWLESLNSDSSVRIKLAILTKKLPPNFEQAILNRIADGSLTAIEYFDLLAMVQDVTALDLALTHTFDFEAQIRWKTILMSLGSSKTIMTWFENLKPEVRFYVSKIILNANAYEYCNWLLKAINQSTNPKSLFTGKVREMRTQLQRAIKRKSMAEKGKLACGEILKLLR
jgi:hypothetical protein